MKFKPYKKIQALHKEECEGILQGTCYIQEKVDGANASIWFDQDDGEIHYGSRTRDLFLAKDDFNGFGTWVSGHPLLKHFFVRFPNVRINGEWLVRHTIGYKETSYKKFYVFDMEKNESLVPFEEMYKIAGQYEIPTVTLFAVFENPTLEEIKSLAGISSLGEKGEGVVIKNLSFINKFGETQFGKFVTQEFKEDNGVTFGGNNKHSETYHEMYYVNKMMTLERVHKILHKLESSVGRLSEKNIPQIMGTCYHDLITEECWVIANEMGKCGKPFDFKRFKNLCDKKSKSIFLEILTGDISVANIKNNV